MTPEIGGGETWPGGTTFERVSESAYVLQTEEVAMTLFFGWRAHYRILRQLSLLAPILLGMRDMKMGEMRYLDYLQTTQRLRIPSCFLASTVVGLRGSLTNSVLLLVRRQRGQHLKPLRVLLPHRWMPLSCPNSDAGLVMGVTAKDVTKRLNLKGKHLHGRGFPFARASCLFDHGVDPTCSDRVVNRIYNFTRNSP